MSKKLFVIFSLLILLSSVIVHILPIRNNHFHFTVDQGRDGIFAREILTKGRIFLKGPETSIRGVFAGPLWYYFVSLGYLIFDGHPFGAVFMVIILNLVLSVFLLWQLASEVGKIKALLVVTVLQFYWYFYYTSLWAFNPFLLVALSILEIILLVRFLGGKSKHYLYASIPVLLAFNCEVAGAVSLLLLYILVGLWGKLKQKITVKLFLLCTVVILALPTIGIARQFLNEFLKTKVISYSAGGLGVFTGTNFVRMANEFVKIIGNTGVPQNVYIGFLAFAAITFHFFQQRKINKFIFKFVTLTLILTIISYFFFASNKGWRDWHSLNLSPLLFISLLLMLFAFQKKIGIILLVAIAFLQIAYFVQRYRDYLKTNDPSILANRLSVLDWIYKENEGNGFNAYTYTNTFYDYPYQYLFWWYGRKKYGFVPCEYSNFPLSLKELYVPGYLNYSEPRLGCDKIRFLIIESDTNGEANYDWIEKFRKYNNLVTSIKVGGVKIEKYYVK